jgi:hypothetical protein
LSYRNFLATELKVLTAYAVLAVSADPSSNFALQVMLVFAFVMGIIAKIIEEMQK